MNNLLVEYVKKQLQPIYDTLSDIPKSEMCEEGTAIVVAFHNKGDMLFHAVGFPHGVATCVKQIVTNTYDDLVKLIFKEAANGTVR